jgi:hypothetical protein
LLVTERRNGASLIRLGLTEPWAEQTLTDLGWWDGGRPVRQAEPVMWALARSPDPNLALRALERLAKADRPSGPHWTPPCAATRACAAGCWRCWAPPRRSGTTW